MTRQEFRRRFRSTGPVVLPVIHVLDSAQTQTNIDLLVGAGAPGCFLINHDFGVDEFMPILSHARRANPDLWLGLNFLAVTGGGAFPRLGELAAEGLAFDAYWADDARIEEKGAGQAEAEAIAEARAASGWRGLYFGGTAFKKQREVAAADHEAAARAARPYMDVVTTSGVATGRAADLDKIAAFRRGIGDAPLAVASGVTPDNARAYGDVDCFMVATGVNRDGDFYNLDEARLTRLLRVCEEMGTNDD